MNNSASFTQKELFSILGDNTQCPPSNCIGISTDSRNVLAGNLYVPLKGEQFDGHDFIHDAMSKGAAGILVQEDSLKNIHGLDQIPHIIVSDTLKALGQLAHAHRKRFDIPIIAIAGAAGKTSTKDCAAYILGTQKSTLKTTANYNNQIGVPLMMLQLHEQHEAAVIEIGTNEPGEIEILSSMLAPTHGLITNIGKEHLEKLIDLDGVEKEETALFTWLEQCGGTRLINLNDDRLKSYAHGPRFATYALDIDADIHASWILNPQGLAEITLKAQNTIEKIQLTLPGKVGAMTAIAGACIGLSVGISLSQIAEALRAYEAPVYSGYGRMSKIMLDDIMVLNDSYNANPASMITALETLQSMPTGEKRYAILGDMRELGISAKKEHIALLANIPQYCDECIVTGPEFQKAIQNTNTKTILFANSPEECARMIHEKAIPGDIVLIKGSRGIQLEKVLEYWRNYRNTIEPS
jgi:UDP-N-acetylmuramoyl-tripeptide--D-alanyl-D-alanine ligase